MKRILISGYYGFNNSGDEAILRLMLANLHAQLPEAELTVLSHNPEDTTRRYGVRAVQRMSLWQILREVAHCDLLISGGGSLLQDATSQRSLLYYLTIINLAHRMGKKVFIYSQGIGPLNSPKNRRRTASALRRVDGIVVRDLQSKELLEEIGLNVAQVQVTSDPVLRADRPDLHRGEEILLAEHCPPARSGRLRVAWSMKGGDEDFILRQEEAIRWLQQNRNVDVILIPFHENQDKSVGRRMRRDLGGSVTLLEGRYLSEDLLSVVGNMDLLIGVRLHSLIYAAVMGVPMLGISYDPKIDSFLKVLGRTPVSDVQHFTPERLAVEFDYLVASRQRVQEQIDRNVLQARQELNINETMIAALLQK